MNQTECIVIGGGIVGLSAAIGLRQQGYRVVVLNQAAYDNPMNYPGARVYALNAASERLFKQLNVWRKIDQQRLAPYQHMHVWEGITHAAIDFHARDYGLPYLGYMIESCVMKQALFETANELGVELNYGVDVDEYVKDDRQLWLITDGAQSPMREKLGAAVTSWPYHQTAIVTTLQTEQSHQETAWQIFTDDGPLAFLPLSRPHHVSIVYSTSIKHAEQLMDLDDNSFASVVAKAFEMRLGACKVISKRLTFPLAMRQAQQYCGKNWLLLGDAAHTIHPMAGQGLNVGLADVRTWLHLLAAEARPLLSQVRLQKYQRQRKSQVWAMILALEGLKWSFSSASLPWVTLRNQGLNFCQRSYLIKQFLLDKAQGCF